MFRFYQKGIFLTITFGLQKNMSSELLHQSRVFKSNQENNLLSHNYNTLSFKKKSDFCKSTDSKEKIFELKSSITYDPCLEKENLKILNEKKV